MRPAGAPAGFNYLRVDSASQGRPRPWLLGALVGALLAGAWVGRENQALEAERGQQRLLQAQVKKAEDAARGAAELDRLELEGREQAMTLRAWQAQRLHLLAWMEALAGCSDMRVVQLRIDGQTLTLQALAPSAKAQPSVTACAVPGSDSPELLEVAAPPDAESAPQQARLTLRWPFPASGAAP